MLQKYLSFLLLAILAKELWSSFWSGNSIFVSTFCGAWLNKVKIFAGQWKLATLLPVWLALFTIERSIVVTIIYKAIGNGGGKALSLSPVFTKNLLTHKLFRFLSCRIQESECKFTGPNKNTNNFTCLFLYQFVAILSQKYQAFPAVVAFNQGLPIFHFLF
jgi:hypothetical protein